MTLNLRVVSELPPYTGVAQGGVLLAAQEPRVVVEVLVAVGLLQDAPVAKVKRVAVGLLPVRVDNDLVDVGGAVIHLWAGGCLPLGPLQCDAQGSVACRSPFASVSELS